MLDPSTVEKKLVRDLGRAATWIAKAIEARPSNIEVVLPEYGNVELGSADIPPVVVSIRSGEVTHLDFIAGLESGDLDGIRRIATDWMQGRLDSLRVVGASDVALKSGMFGLGTHKLSQEYVFQGWLRTLPCF